MEIHLGTGGWSNDDWLGILYPEGTAKRDYLSVYARHFHAVELNSSFYAIPGIKAFEGMLRNSGGRVRFAVKAHRSFTHDRDATRDLAQRLRESVAPLRDAGMLGPILLQFPYSFHRTAANRRWLAEAVAWFEDETLAVEFRNEAWHVDAVRASFREMGLSWVSVDYPQVRGMPAPELVVTSPIAYLRMHGRNEDAWYGASSAAARHDYRYARDELRSWVQWIAEAREELEQVYVMMLNTTKGHAIHDLRTLAELLREHDLEAPIEL